MNIKKKWWITKILISILFAYGLFYFSLPAINLTDPNFYVYLVIVSAFVFFVSIPEVFDFKRVKIANRKGPKSVTFLSGFIILIFGMLFIVNIIGSPLFNAKGYGKRISIISDNNFVDDVKPVNFKALPLLDKDSSRKLGDRVMGQMPELVSQFVVSDLYTQINFEDEIVRVTPLEYAGLIKYFTNRNKGVQGYITVNSVSGDSKLIKLDKGMKIMPSAILGEDLDRYLRFKYPTLIFGQESFEIDNGNNPYWIIPIIKYHHIGLRENINGVVVLDPITGKTTKYNSDNIPSWVDHVYPSDLIINQVNDWGKYQSGFFNSVFGQKGVVQTTEGYNYTVMNDDVYLYTGITSTSTDESNLGFILTNLRTKETHFYSVPGAEEYSAMASAEGQVQQMKYTSSFPLLINLNNRPTYLVSLKDDGGLVKMYAFVDVVDYQKVVVTDSALGIEKAAENYLNSVDQTQTNQVKTSTKITVKEIKSVIIDGNTHYFIIDEKNSTFKVALKVNETKLPFVKKDDVIDIVYITNKNINVILEVK